MSVRDLRDASLPPQHIIDGDRLVLGNLDYHTILKAPFVCCRCGLAHDFSFELERDESGDPVLHITIAQNDDLTAQCLHEADGKAAGRGEADPPTPPPA